jgi:hypothetical protein
MARALIGEGPGFADILWAHAQDDAIGQFPPKPGKSRKDTDRVESEMDFGHAVGPCIGSV